MADSPKETNDGHGSDAVAAGKPDPRMLEMAINPFKMHLSDALIALHLATSGSVGGYPETRVAIASFLSRTSVANAVFALESAANCFVEQIPRRRDVRDNIEMWPVIDKFETYLLGVRGQPKMTDGKEMAAIRSLIKLRDAHVHPKMRTLPVIQTAEGKAEVMLKDTLAIDIASVALAWKPEDARTAITAVLEFLRLFFSITRIPPEGIATILSSRMKFNDGHRLGDHGGQDQILKSTANALGFDLSFLFPS